MHHPRPARPGEDLRHLIYRQIDGNLETYGTGHHAVRRR